MHAVYGFVVGPLAWIAGAVFVLGLVFRLWVFYDLARRKDPMVLEYMSPKYALRSILHWSIPFHPVNSRRHPVMTAVTFLFHLSLVFTPLFLGAHMMLMDYYHGLSWPTLPDPLADLLTVVVIGACVFFGVRRVVRPEVRYVTTAKDWAILVLVALPFVTGFLAYHQIGPYQAMVVLHILSGEGWLMAIPFTRLSHMMLAPFIRGYIGSEFGAVRHARDW
jgi:nitrate reductase gamma subunit